MSPPSASNVIGVDKGDLDLQHAALDASTSVMPSSLLIWRTQLALQGLDSTVLGSGTASETPAVNTAIAEPRSRIVVQASMSMRLDTTADIAVRCRFNKSVKMTVVHQQQAKRSPSPGPASS